MEDGVGSGGLLAMGGQRRLSSPVMMDLVGRGCTKNPWLDTVVRITGEQNVAGGLLSFSSSSSSSSSSSFSSFKAEGERHDGRGIPCWQDHYL